MFVTGVLLFKEHNLETTSANSDYICVKAAENSACNAIEGTCSPWENGIRRCNGIQYTMVAYHSVRTSCAS
ncbi:MAG: hypothetical protein LBF15_04770 [Candidatus Peribacteria bacterium]|nr:hypothetical protein [Candidatus Peribacteria bacterium]